MDWRNAPIKFQFKLSEKERTQVLSIENVQEFGLDKGIIFRRFPVEIDHSTTRIDWLPFDPLPKFKKDTLFLKLLVEGKASLYVYQYEGEESFFYSLDNDKSVQQLLQKAFLSKKNKVHYNYRYKAQLSENLVCNDENKTALLDLQYNYKDLSAYFISYNECNNSTYKDFSKKQTRASFVLNVRPGVNFSRLSVSEGSISTFTEFDQEIHFRFGLESEVFLPFDNKRWSFFLEPTLVVNNQLEARNEDYSLNVAIENIELPFGGRYYFSLNNNSSMFFEGGVILSSLLRARLTYESVTGASGLVTIVYSNFFYGLGFKVGEARIGIRNNQKRRIHTSSVSYDSLVLTLGYNLIKPAKK
ncbi:MAG: outer membrane beta-barrel protein [Bacteroidota bacterium]